MTTDEFKQWVEDEGKEAIQSSQDLEAGNIDDDPLWLWRTDQDIADEDAKLGIDPSRYRRDEPSSQRDTSAVADVPPGSLQEGAEDIVADDRSEARANALTNHIQQHPNCRIDVDSDGEGCILKSSK